jgi:hypothetical protein
MQCVIRIFLSFGVPQKIFRQRTELLYGCGKSKGSAATTVGYHGNGSGGNKEDSKGNSGENGERGGNNEGGVSHLSLIFFFLNEFRTGYKVRFLLNT